MNVLPAKIGAQGPTKDAHQAALPSSALVVEGGPGDVFQVFRFERKPTAHTIHPCGESHEHALKAAIVLSRSGLTVKFREFLIVQNDCHICFSFPALRQPAWQCGNVVKTLCARSRAIRRLRVKISLHL
jgi:hypothetical protein